MNFDKICRTCLAETTDSKCLFSVQLVKNENLSLSELLLACTSIQVSETDGLPQQVCRQCAQDMLNSFCFQKQCLKADSTLKSFMSGAFETQFIQMKSPDVSVEHSFGPPSRIKEETLGHTALQSGTVDDTLNGQDIVVDTFNNEIDSEIDNLDDESFDKHVPIENRISNLVVSRYEDTDVLNNADCNMDFDIKLASTDLAIAREPHRNVCVKTKKININIDMQEKELKTDYQVGSRDLKIIKIESQRKQDDDTMQPLFPCEDKGCVACFTTESDLKLHMKTHCRTRYCKPCKQIFSSASTLSRHVNSKHQTGKKVHLCNECGKGFGRSDDLKRHLRVHTGERPFRCEKCGKAFAQSFRLLEHMRAHSNEKNFICAICGKAFARYTSLLGHTKTHSGIKSHECKECGKRLCGASSLAMHMKIHTGERNYVCTYCGKGFAARSNLITHKRIHTGEKPFVCKTCGKGFADQSRLNVHNRIHSGEKPYVCSYCNRGCVSSSQLKKHIRIHTGERPYKCKMCEKSFHRSEDLKIHVKIHKGERNHVCVVCQKGFYQATTLKVHMRIHTGEKPYHCSICNKSFSQTGPYSIHMKTHGKDKLSQNIELNVNEKIV